MGGLYKLKHSPNKKPSRNSGGLFWWKILGSNLDPPDYTSGCAEPAAFLISLSISFLLFHDFICFSRAKASALVENASENLSIQSPVLPVKPA
jgi:hypothetical protein